MMLARLRLDHQAIRGMLTRTHRDISLSHAHLALLVAAQTVEDIA
jgi:hypothetical protein